MLPLSSADFSRSTFSKKYFQEHYQSVQIRTDIMLHARIQKVLSEGVRPTLTTFYFFYFFFFFFFFTVAERIQIL